MPLFRSLVALIALLPALSSACTTLALPQSPEKMGGKSYDWFQHHGLALVNARNVKKTALLLTADKPAQWVSKYGSLTFNQHGREMPLAGMNEKGLTVDIMILDSTEYAPAGKTPAITELQWIQYILDGAANVTEAVQLANAVNIVPAVAKVHFMVCDVTGDCATFEYLKRGLDVHHGLKGPLTVLTNSEYSESLKYLRTFSGFGGARPTPSGSSSLSRFVRAATYVQNYDPAKVSDPVTSVFAALASVKQADTTWNLVYERGNRRIHFRTKGLPKIKTIDTSKLDYSCKKKPQFVDMKTSSTQGDVTGDLADFNALTNSALVQTGMTPFARQVPAGTLDRIAQYPATLQCLE